MNDNDDTPALTYRSGRVRLVRAAADPGYAVAPGTPVCLTGGLVRPASGVPWAGDGAATRGAFAGAFLGVAHSASPAGDGGPVSVDVSPDAVYALPLEPGGCDLGAPLGPADDGTALADARLTVAGPGAAVGRAAEAAGPAAREVRVTFASAFAAGTGHAAALLGG